MKPFQTDSDIDVTAQVSVRNAAQLIADSEALRSRREKANRKRFSRLFKDPTAIEVTITLTDEVMRIHSAREAAVIFRRVAKKASVTGFGLFNGFGLKVIGVLSRLTPGAVVKVVHSRVRSLSKDLILAAEPQKLGKHLALRESEGIRLNINVLGEAVLGQSEADERLARIFEMIRRPEVTYISVKLSAVIAQMITFNHQGNLDAIAEKLRLIYREANVHHTFVNLDMEEFRDLDMTVAGFKKILSEPEFLSMSAGIVLQAYLPESHSVFADLVQWAQERHAHKGGQIKIRLVKGANLAMERAEAELNGFIPAPYGSKSDVDASYARLIDAALRPEHAHAVRIGIASHNLFHLTWAIEVARTRGVMDQIDIEMLEGMANGEAHAVVKSGHHVLFYTPVTKADDFASAVAYLVRRLDENTSDENYLKAAFDIGSNKSKFEEQKSRFLQSIAERHTISTASRRHQPDSVDYSQFHTQANGDPTEAGYIQSVVKAINGIKKYSEEIPLVINGEHIATGQLVEGTDPGANSQIWYHYNVARLSDIDAAMSAARKGIEAWGSRTVAERKAILFKSAELMQQQRALAIAVMSRDAGKTVSEADPEVSEAIDFARYYASHGVENTDSRPMGVVVVVPPWNFPYAIPAGGVFAALAAGNTVIIKPAPETVATAWLLVQQLWEAGVPKEALHFVPTRDDEVGQSLVSHPNVDALILTGAFDTAKMFISWRNDLNLLAETSGKNSIVISACADIDAAVKDLVQSAFGHAGQKCSAASLGIVVESVFKNPAFLRQLIDDVSTLRVGAGWNFSTSVGPVIHAPEGNLQRALTTLDEGESWLIAPEQIDSAGNLWKPGVKLGIQPGSWSHQNEWFGPVLGIMVAPDLATAIQWQSDMQYGLTAGFHSLDQAECELWMDLVQAGNLYINRGITGAVVERQPFGGWKRSSVGATAKAGGANYVNCLRTWKVLESFSAAKWSADEWWKNIGSRAIDRSGLTVEKNYQRYRRPLYPIIVRVGDTTNNEEVAHIKYIAKVAGIEIDWSTEDSESIDQLVNRAQSKVRWLSSEVAPRAELLARGVSLDTRPIAQRGDIEFPRWLLEQSVSITYHRYGNVNGGPKPRCAGLGD